MFHKAAHSGVCFSNILFVTDGTFQKINCVCGVTRVNVVDEIVLFSLVTGVVAVFCELWTCTAL